MFDLSYKKILNKRRPYGIRGPKKRYSVYRAELNSTREQRNEDICRSYCDHNNLNLDDYFINDSKLPWTMTWEYIRITKRYFPYTMSSYVRSRYNSDDIKKLENNIKIAEQLNEQRHST